MKDGSINLQVEEEFVVRISGPHGYEAEMMEQLGRHIRQGFDRPVKMRSLQLINHGDEKEIKVVCVFKAGYKLERTEPS